ncbi:hypothetical protein AMECASPLE_025788 [Ameca splendens]|uniref:Uncharacterized protein n=1 Tax=Ameca splendens TaxID=208324 RepID=A0ABV0Y4L7_9TELE
MGERRGTPWTGRQSITGQHRDTENKQPFTHPFIPVGSLAETGCFWTDEGRWSTRREPTHAQEEHTNSMQKDPWSETHDLLAARQQCYQLSHSAASYEPSSINNY